MKGHIATVCILIFLALSGFLYFRHFQNQVNLQLSQLQSSVQTSKKQVGSLQGEKIDRLEIAGQAYAVYKIFVEYSPSSNDQAGVLVIKPDYVGNPGPVLATPFRQLQKADKPYAVTKDNLLMINGSELKINKYKLDGNLTLVKNVNLLINNPSKIECNFANSICTISSGECSVVYNSSTDEMGKVVCKEITP